ncbi:Putative ribonuclease H protein At1g65750 [Linum grandiflorum]
MKAGPLLNKGTQWALRDGRLTRFWTDRWLDSGITLIDHALNIQGVSSSSTVADFVLENGEWNSDLILSCLPYQVALQVFGMTPPVAHLGTDSMGWGLETSGKFTIRTAYLLLKELKEEPEVSQWKSVWRWQATELNKEWSAWLNDHIRHTTHSLVFGVGVWLLWRARNKRLFEQDIENHMEVAHRCDYWVALISSSWKIGQLGREVRSLTRQTQLIGWRPWDEGWFNLSTDGSLRSPTKVAAAGGVIRTDTCRFVKAFAANLGSCSITRAEMQAIVDGLKLAWSLGIRRIRVQSDSRTAIAIFAKDSELDHQHAALVMGSSDLPYLPRS